MPTKRAERKTVVMASCDSYPPPRSLLLFPLISRETAAGNGGEKEERSARQLGLWGREREREREVE